MRTVKIKFLLLLSLSLSIINVFGQTEQEDPPQYLPKFYLGTSTGFDCINGMMGLNGELNLSPKVSAFGGGGISSWGLRASLGARIYKNYPKGLFYTVSFSSNSGIPEVEIDMETTTSSSEAVQLELKSAKTINLGLGNQFSLLNNKLRINLETGYSIPIKKGEYNVTSNHKLTEVSESVLNLISPGGFILVLGLSVGI